MPSNKSLHPAVQKVVTLWPVLGAVFGLIAFGLNASAQINSNKDGLADLKSRVERLETAIPAIREDLATIKQQGKDIEERLDDRRSK